MFKGHSQKSNLISLSLIKQPSIPNNQNPHRIINPIHYLVIYFNIFGQYMPILPIYLAKDQATGKITLKSSGRGKKILCGFTSSWIICGEITRFFRHVLYKKPIQNNPASYFELTERVITLVQVNFTVGTIWFKLKYLENICNILQDSKFGLTDIFTSEISKTRRIISFSYVVIICVLTNPLTFILAEFARNNWNCSKTLEAWCNNYFKQFFFDFFLPLPSELEGFMKLISGIFGFIFVFGGRFVWNFIEWLPIVCALILHFVLDGFNESLKEKKGWGSLVDREKIINTYRSIILLSNKLNHIVGASVFNLVLLRIPHYVPIILTVFSPPNLFSFLRYGISLAHLSVFIGLAAILNNKGNYMGAWLESPHIHCTMPLQQLNILMHQINSNPIGIRCFKFIKLSNGFLGSVITSLLTFAVILLQFKVGSGPLTDCKRIFEEMNCQCLNISEPSNLFHVIK